MLGTRPCSRARLWCLCGAGAPRNFALCDAATAEPLLLLTLLSPHVTVHTNLKRAEGRGEVVAEPTSPDRSDGKGGGTGAWAAGEVADAVKVMYGEVPRRRAAAARRRERRRGRSRLTHPPTRSLGQAGGDGPGRALARWHATGGLRLLWLAREGCEAVLSELRASARLVPRVGRRLGALELGFLPVAPTWD